jgi:hypothetical protein
VVASPPGGFCSENAFALPGAGDHVHRLALASFLALLAAAAPRTASAELRIRGGLEMPLLVHTSQAPASGTTSFADGISPALNVMLSAYPSDFLGFDAEFKYGFAGTGSFARQGTSIGPGVTLNPPLLPLYVRASLPIHLEPGDARLDLRAAAGLTFNLVLLSLYLEGAVDFPLAGNGVDAFKTQTVSLGAGAWLKF